MRKLLPAVAAALAGCSTVRVPVPVIRAPEINLTRYKQIAVGEVKGPAADDIGGRLKQALVENGAFKVVDRAHLDQIMGELKLSGSDLADPESRRKLGKLLTGAVLIFAKVGQADYREDVSTSEYETDKKDKAGKVIGKEKHTRYTLTGRAVARVSFDVVDVETGELLKSKMLEHVAEDTNVRTDGVPESLDRAGMERTCRQSVVDQFMRSIAPYKVIVQAAFLTDGDLPQLEMVTRYAKAGDWDAARKDALGAVAQCDTNPELDAKTCGKAHWDLGLVHEYTGEFDKAIAEVKKAFALTDDDDMLAEVAEIERMRADAKKLAADAAAGAEAAQ